jgi:hypothetical protein
MREEQQAFTEEFVRELRAAAKSVHDPQDRMLEESNERIVELAAALIEQKLKIGNGKLDIVDSLTYLHEHTRHSGTRWDALGRIDGYEKVPTKILVTELAVIRAMITTLLNQIAEEGLK